MSDSISIFQEYHPSIDSYWRSIVLFGVNVASYKFALAISLLELSERGMTSVTLEELAKPFSKHICDHMQNAPKQYIRDSGAFLDACKKYNIHEISEDQLLSITRQKGFDCVIDAFHTVNRAEIPLRFYEKDYSSRSKRIILTDEIFKLGEITDKMSLLSEAESRWNLVETAWSLGISRNLIKVNYDEEHKRLFVIDNRHPRIDVTSARGALNGYQKGRCFYCHRDIFVSDGEGNTCEVDHFFPHALQKREPDSDLKINGVWNLVLCCTECNRGKNGKFDNVPHLDYVKELHRRNEYLISSHHPLKETLIKQTGDTEDKRRDFIQGMYNLAKDRLSHTWYTEEVQEATF